MAGYVVSAISTVALTQNVTEVIVPENPTRNGLLISNASSHPVTWAWRTKGGSETIDATAFPLASGEQLFLVGEGVCACALVMFTTHTGVSVQVQEW